MRVVFLGSPAEVLPVIEKLEELHEEKVIDFVGVVSQPARPSGRKQVLTDPPVAAYAKMQALVVLQPEKSRDPEFLAQFAALKPDVAITAAYGQILSDAFLAIPTRATINLHPSLLPAYRGATPVPAALLDGCEDTGISILFTVKALDAGAIIVQEKTHVHVTETADVLMTRLFEAGAQLLPKALQLLEDSNFKGVEQDPTQITHCKRFSRADGAVNWSLDSAEILRRFRAFYPWPGTYAAWNGKRVIFHQMHRLADLKGEGQPGHYEFDKQSQQLLITTGSGVLACQSLQVEGTRMSSASSFWNGAGQNGPHHFESVIGGAK